MSGLSGAFHGQLCGGPYPAPGIRSGARFDGERLLLEVDNIEVPVAALIVSVGGFEEPELFLNWLGENGRQWSLQPAGTEQIELLMAAAPASLQGQFSQWQLRHRHRQHAWGWIGGVAGGAVLLGALCWWSYPHLTGWLARRIPQSIEEKLGQAALAQLRTQGRLLDSGPAQQAVQQIGSRLTQGSRYRYRWLVKQDSSVNAFAMPGGIVVVHSALLRQASGPNELAAVLAHEVQHIEQRHSLKQMVSSLGLAAAVTVVLGDISSVAALLAHQLGSMYFGRELEAEADRLGFQALLAANIKPDGMLSFFQKLENKKESGKAERGEDLALPSWAASHPATAERIAAIRTMVAARSCPACTDAGAGLDWKRAVDSLGPAPK